MAKKTTRRDRSYQFVRALVDELEEIIAQPPCDIEVKLQSKPKLRTLRAELIALLAEVGWTEAYTRIAKKR